MYMNLQVSKTASAERRFVRDLEDNKFLARISTILVKCSCWVYLDSWLTARKLDAHLVDCTHCVNPNNFDEFY